MENKKTKGISLFALLAIIISGAIGGGVFNLANDLANGSTPGGVMISWLFIGFGIWVLLFTTFYTVRYENFKTYIRQITSD